MMHKSTGSKNEFQCFHQSHSWKRLMHLSHCLSERKLYDKGVLISVNQSIKHMATLVSPVPSVASQPPTCRNEYLAPNGAGETGSLTRCWPPHSLACWQIKENMDANTIFPKCLYGTTGYIIPAKSVTKLPHFLVYLDEQAELNAESQPEEIHEKLKKKSKTNKATNSSKTV